MSEWYSSRTVVIVHNRSKENILKYTNFNIQKEIEGV